MKNLEALQSMDEQMREERVKADQLQQKYENGRIPESEYKIQMQGIEKTADILGNEIEEEIKRQGISEQEYSEAKNEWRQEEDRER